ncbi:MAG TPA: hypothetical protein VGH76_01530 [Actinomycetospora sp.]|jgi:hypothetical protein|uniref:hypothetical protein n=1 Tax=Actinomycetospora sp. TaxID=1872135 RepID=UPI002F3FB02C
MTPTRVTPARGLVVRGIDGSAGCRALVEAVRAAARRGVVPGSERARAHAVA